MRIEFCGNCDFYQDRECRRFPPVPCKFLVDNQEMRYETAFVFPEVGTDSPCCGEFKTLKPFGPPTIGPVRAAAPSSPPPPKPKR